MAQPTSGLTLFLGGGELLRRLKATDALFFADEILCEFLAETTFLEQTLLADIILVSARFPTPDVLGVEALAGDAEIPIRTKSSSMV